MISYSCFTNQGDRQINEDSLNVVDLGDKKCFILCDGLGGHGMGDIASSTAASVFSDLFEKESDSEHFIEDAFAASQDIILMEQEVIHARGKMKTTAVVLTVDGTTAKFAHVGDSRLYVFRKDKVKKRTLDHSVPQMLAKAKDISEEQIRFHPDRSILTRVVGVEWDEPQYEISKPIPLKKCQAFLLCSDGFWELITEDTMCKLLKESTSAEDWLEKMISEVKKNGAGKDMDNYSAIAIWNIRGEVSEIK